MTALDIQRPARLRRSADIRAVFDARRRVAGKVVSVHVRDRGDVQPPRMTVVAGRRVGSAVQRNRAKRRIRSVVDESGIPVGRDAVFVARPGADTAPFDTLRRDVHRVREAGLGRRRAQGARNG